MDRMKNISDSGSYQCGETGRWGNDVELKVKRGPICSCPSAVTGFLGETLTINCSSPEEFKSNAKSFHKLNGQVVTKVINRTWSQINRFSMSEDSEVVSVKIRDVKEEDKGDYYCAAWNSEKLVSYFSYYTSIQLQVTVTSPATTTPSGEYSSKHSVCPSFIVIITVCVCVALLLISVSALIFFTLRHKKTQDSAFMNRQCGANHANMDMDLVYQNLKPNKNQSVSIYESLDPITTEPESEY
ncbi:polymeric immunoglobulin receptor-like isoform X2 [Hoplias malabaricus]|uniref:polymeric immunoglobulin receptor-like isoform X2 n=1 Tax=Hoplias malabaricus TaxID=27720 RepID=UPI0034633ABA